MKNIYFLIYFLENLKIKIIKKKILTLFLRHQNLLTKN